MKAKPGCCDGPRMRADVHIRITRLPFVLDGTDGPQYDESEGISEGWDFNEQSECYCAKCSALFDIVQDGEGGFILIRKDVTTGGENGDQDKAVR